MLKRRILSVILVLAMLIPAAYAAQPAQDGMRGVWVSSVVNIDYPSQQGLSARQRPRQGWPPRPVAAGPTWPALFRRGAVSSWESVRLGWPPPAVAAGPAASWRGGRCHVSPAAPAATAEGVLFVKLIQR